MNLIAMLPPRLTRADRAFVAYHQDNPDVYAALVRLALELADKGWDAYGIGSLFEVVRWHHAIQTVDRANTYKMANAHRAYYARLIMHREPRLRGFFKLCTQRSGNFAAVLGVINV